MICKLKVISVNVGAATGDKLMDVIQTKWTFIQIDSTTSFFALSSSGFKFLVVVLYDTRRTLKTILLFDFNLMCTEL